MYPNKFDSSIGVFWYASLFVGALVTVIIGRNGNGHSDWLWAILIGVIIFNYWIDYSRNPNTFKK